MKEPVEHTYNMKDDDYIMRLPEVIRKVGLSRASLYSMVSAGTFPRQITLSRRSVGWLASEVDAWLRLKIGQRSA